MLPSWLLAAIFGTLSTILTGMIVYIWKGRNQGYVTETRHEELCQKTQERVSADIEKLSHSFREILSAQYQSITDLMNAKFEGLNDKIENTVLREIRMMNGVGKHKRKKPTKQH